MLFFRLYYEDTLVPNSKLKMRETFVTNLSLEDLMPNTQYLVYTTAIIVHGGTEVESSRSEKLMVWTEAAEPAFIEVFMSIQAMPFCQFIFADSDN